MGGKAVRGVDAVLEMEQKSLGDVEAVSRGRLMLGTTKEMRTGD